MPVIFFLLFEYIVMMKIKYQKFQQVYKVENESLNDIAKKFDINVVLLKKINNIEHVSKGDYIIMPTENTYVVKPMESIYTIAQKLNVNPEYLKQKNNTANVFIGQILFY